MNLIKKILPLLLAILLVYTVSIFWHDISLPFYNQNNILGEYSENNHNQNNDTLRFICFIFFPIIIFFICSLFIKRGRFETFKETFLRNKSDVYFSKKNKIKLIYLLIFFIIISLKFLSLDLPDYKLDLFHEGQLLSGALNYKLKNEFWVGSYLNTGLFYDILNTNIAWNIFDQESVGSYRIFNLFLNYLFSFTVVVFIFYITKIFNLSQEKENLFFILLSIFCIYFYTIKSSNFPNYRDLFSFLFMIFMINAFYLEKYKLKILSFFLIGNFSVISLLWSLDRGIFLNATIVILLIILSFKKKFVESCFLISGLFFSWLIFLSLIGIDEFNSFISNSVNIILYNEMWNGLIHPQPFSDEKNSTRATKALILFVINGIILTKYLLKKNFMNSSSKIILIIIFCLGIFYYKVGLSRSDGGHIVIGSSINYILFIILLVFSLLNFKFSLKKNISFVFIFVYTIFQFSQFSFSNIYNFKTRINNFTQKKDDFFLNNNHSKFINQVSEIIKLENCIQNFNYDPTLYYLTKKKSCTKFYQVFSMATEDDQLNFIEEIESSKTNILIVDFKKNKYRYSPDFRFSILSKYIQENFAIYKKINEFNILKKLND